MLQDFVDKRWSRLDVVYTVSGWLNKNPPSYKVRLVSGLKLEEAKQDLTLAAQLRSIAFKLAFPEIQ
ncbi:hypothetical protein LINPERPRIM_LOCUS24177, partial [Linum perenne]